MLTGYGVAKTARENFLFISVVFFIFFSGNNVFSQDSKMVVNVEKIVFSSPSPSGERNVQIVIQTEPMFIQSIMLYIWGRDNNKWVSLVLAKGDEENSWEGMVRLEVSEDELPVLLCLRDSTGRTIYVIPEDEIEGVQNIDFSNGMSLDNILWFSLCEGERDDGVEKSLDIIDCSFSFDNENLVLKMQTLGKIPKSGETESKSVYGVEFRAEGEQKQIMSAYYSPFLHDTNIVEWKAWDALMLMEAALVKTSLTEFWGGWDFIKKGDEIETYSRGTFLYLKIPKDGFPGSKDLFRVFSATALYRMGAPIQMSSKELEFLVARIETKLEVTSAFECNDCRVYVGYVREIKDKSIQDVYMMFYPDLVASVER